MWSFMLESPKRRQPKKLRRGTGSNFLQLDPREQAAANAAEAKRKAEAQEPQGVADPPAEALAEASAKKDAPDPPAPSSWKVVARPNLGLKLSIGQVYNREDLVSRCAGNKAKLKDLEQKLKRRQKSHGNGAMAMVNHRPKVFEPVLEAEAGEIRGDPVVVSTDDVVHIASPWWVVVHG
eukprot:Skav216916  [mRNA]  locus=scaffold1838:20416:31799:- [translate_table: standard]